MKRRHHHTPTGTAKIRALTTPNAVLPAVGQDVLDAARNTAQAVKRQHTLQHTHTNSLCLCSHKSLHVDGFSHIIHKHQNSEPARIPSRSM